MDDILEILEQNARTSMEIWLNLPEKQKRRGGGDKKL